ncbi:hypothetical protein EW146_g3731 [Bondarzewia mesenterica]|uniref:Uncharacterized protein n=1 Tax=Bondarzewia mesenterica TaxID=1095465 RepID=A0A4S4LYU9_9AGAM|nr:hypothetical protein EW146_g3731 [Bondarzewia mesenterica]
MSSNYATSFAPYAPPPDEPDYNQPSSSRVARPWFPVHTSSQQVTSYQSGGIPTWNTSASGGMGAVDQAEEQQNQWETRYKTRVDVLAACAYVIGPVSALTLLIAETHNDYVRFHAYQSALLTTPLLLIRIMASLFGFPSFMCTFFTLLLVFPALFMAYHAYRGAAQNGMARFHLPGIGQLAEQWLQEE